MGYRIHYSLQEGTLSAVVSGQSTPASAGCIARDIAARPPTGVRWTKLAINKVLVNQLNLNLELGLMAEFLVGYGSSSLADVKRRQEGS